MEMDAKDEYNRVVDGLRDHLELLLSSGVAYIPAVPSPSARPARTEEPGRGASAGFTAGDLVRRVMECGVCAPAPPGGRKKVERGKGGENSKLVFVGGAPSAHDAAGGEPFASGEGDLLTRMIEAMGFKRESVYVMNSVRCVSSGEPTDEEAASCKGFLEEELSFLRAAKVVVTLGATAASALLGSRDVGGLRGRFHELRGLKVMATYGTEDLLKDPSLKKYAWEDLKMVMKELEKG